MRAALRHAIYRNHECTDACSACVEAEAALEGRKTPQQVIREAGEDA